MPSFPSECHLQEHYCPLLEPLQGLNLDEGRFCWESHLFKLHPFATVYRDPKRIGSLRSLQCHLPNKAKFLLTIPHPPSPQTTPTPPPPRAGGKKYKKNKNILTHRVSYPCTMYSTELLEVSLVLSPSIGNVFGTVRFLLLPLPFRTLKSIKIKK